MERSATPAEVQTGRNGDRRGKYAVPDHPVHVLPDARAEFTVSPCRHQRRRRCADGRSAKTADPASSAAWPAAPGPAAKALTCFVWKMPPRMLKEEAAS